MSCDYLSCLRKLLHWLFAFVMALLPQHLIAQLGDADFLAAPRTAMIEPATPATEAARSEAGPADAATVPAGATQTQARPVR